MLFDTPPLDIIDVTADSRHHGGPRVMPPQFIVLHHTGAWPASKYLSTDMSSDVSSHRYIEPNFPIMKLVPDELIAYTQGFADVGPWSDKFRHNFNVVSLSMELAFDPVRQTTWDRAVVWKAACQTVSWWSDYGMLPVVYHSQVDARKDDPLRFPRKLYDAYCLNLLYRALAGRLEDWTINGIDGPSLWSKL